jgi:hypothetical protein
MTLIIYNTHHYYKGIYGFRREIAIFDFLVVLLILIGVFEELVVVNPEVILIFLIIFFIFQIYFRFGEAFYVSFNENVKALIKMQTIRRMVRSNLFRKFIFSNWLQKQGNLKFLYFRLYDNLLYIEE